MDNDFISKVKVKITEEEGKIPLAEVNSPLNYEELSFLHKFTLYHVAVAPLFTVGISLLLTIIFLITKYYLLMICGVIILFTAVCSIFSYKKVKSNLPQDKFRIFKFYDDHFTVSTETTAHSFKYQMLYRVYETEKYILLYLPDKTSFILNKTSLADDTAEKILSEAMGEKYIQKK